MMEAMGTVPLCDGTFIGSECACPKTLLAQAVTAPMEWGSQTLGEEGGPAITPVSCYACV